MSRVIFNSRPLNYYVVDDEQLLDICAKLKPQSRIGRMKDGVAVLAWDTAVYQPEVRHWTALGISDFGPEGELQDFAIDTDFFFISESFYEWWTRCRN